MRRYQPITNPNEVPEGTILRGRNGLYWISQNNTWVLHDGRIPNDEYYRVPRTSLESSPGELEPNDTNDTNDTTDTNISNDSNDIQPQIPINESRLLRMLNEAPRILRRSPVHYDLTSGEDVRQGIYDQPRTLTRSYAMTDLNEADFIPQSPETDRPLPRTVRYDEDDNISYMSFSTDSRDDDRFSVYASQEAEETESVYEEDSDEYTDISSEADSVVNYKSNILDKCLNESPVTLTNYDETDLNDLFIIHIQNQEGKFIKGSCLLRDEMKEILKSELTSFPPSYLMSIYKTPSSKRQDDLLTGLTGKPTGKLIIRLPTNQIYITYGSLQRVLSSPITQWYALPLYGGKLRRVGNVGGIYGASMNHGQVPGFKIYKLFTYDEIKNNIVVKETQDDFPHIYEHDAMLSLFELVGEAPVDIFIKNAISSLINTKVRRRPLIPPRTSSLNPKRERRYGNPPDI